MKTTRDKTFLKEQEERLNKKKEDLEKRLGRFGKKNKQRQSDWLTNYPKFDGGRLEEEADEVEEYDNLLSINYTLEKELKKVIKALEKIRKKTYGLCENCRKPISKKRLKIYPQAKYCLKCQKT